MVLLSVFTSSAKKTKDPISHSLSKPNIIIFYADDLGWQDTQINDVDDPTPFETPNVLRLASQAMFFTQGYSAAPTCAPSRGALLSGLHPAKTHLTHVSGALVPKAKQGNKTVMIAPFYNNHFPENTTTIAEALRSNGYKTGHVGKWHLGQHKNQLPMAEGFDFSFGERGVHKNMPDRTKEFATSRASDKYVLSDKTYAPFSVKHPKGMSYPKDLVTETAVQFVKDSKEKPFFLYLAHWMVHYPIVTRNRVLLEYYCEKLGVPFPKENVPVTTPGQTNPYYGAMVSTLDWSLGILLDYLEKTDDPRHKGKKLIETTYIIFTSDNGGCEDRKTEIFTDNAPFDKGKKYAQEGGVRVPMLIAGPGIQKGSRFDGLINQLDYYPTLLNLTGTKISKEDSKKLSGLDISQVLLGEETKVRDTNGKERESLFWHFPHNAVSQMQSAIRKGDFKLYKNHWDGSFELYQLDSKGKRVDWEEAQNIAVLPAFNSVASEMLQELEALLIENDAEYPHFNPKYSGDLAGKKDVPVISSLTFSNKTKRANAQVEVGKTPISNAYVLALCDDGAQSFTKISAEVSNDGLKVSATIPKKYTGFVMVLIDANNFIVTSKLPVMKQKKHKT